MKNVIAVICLLTCCLQANAQERQESIEVSEKVLDTYLGKYELSPNAQIEVTRDKKQLYVQLTGQQKFEVFPSDEDKFYLKVVEARIVFNKGKDGEVESLTLFQNGNEISGKKIE